MFDEIKYSDDMSLSDYEKLKKLLKSFEVKNPRFCHDFPLILIRN